MALDKKQQQTVVLICMVVGAFFYVYWSYGLTPTNQKIVRLEKELKEVQGKVETMKRTAQRLPALKREYDGLLAEVGQTEKRLPKEKSLDDVLRVVTEESMKNRVVIRNFSPSTGKEQPYFVEIPIQLSFSTQFHNLGRFLTTLGLQERILTARGLNISYAPDAKRGNTISGSFTLTAFMFKG